jgi:adiponectin receptor
VRVFAFCFSVQLDCNLYFLAGVFMTFGLSGVVPAVHHAVADGWFNAISKASLGWLILMGCLYILGALFYALRVPERFFPGKCDYVVSAVTNFKITEKKVHKKKLTSYGTLISSPINFHISWFLQFQSHQIFHVLVVAAAFVHFHGISEMAMYRMSVGSCDAQNDPPLDF